MAMNKEEVKIKLSLVINNSEYIRVSESHPLELYLGLNEKGNPTLRYNGAFQPVKVIGNSLLEIKQIKTASYNSLLFCFNSTDNLSLSLESMLTQSIMRTFKYKICLECQTLLTQSFGRRQ